MQNIKKRTFWLLAIIGLLFTITACSKSESNPNEMKIEFANSNYEYVVGETFKLNPSIQNGTAEDSELVWSIFDESVVKLVNGEFVALKEGKTVVKVASATKPNVNAMTSIKVVKNQYFPVVSFDTVLDTMSVDDTQMIRATIEGADFEAKVTYRSLDNNVASVNELGVVEAFNAGSTVIIVRVEEVGDASNYEEYPFLIQVVEPEYAIDYVLNGGKNHLENLDYYTKRQCPVVLKEPTRDGYKFLGWYDLEGNQVTEISKYEEADVTLEAKWEIVKYSANFTLVDFVIENVSTDGDEILLCEDIYDTPTEWWSFIGINKTEKENIFNIMATGYKWDGISNSYDYYIAIHGDYRNESDEKYDTYYRLISLLMDSANAVGKYVYIDMSTNTDMNAAIYEEMDTYTIEEYVNPFVTPVRVGHDFLGWYSVDENGVESSEPVTEIDRGSKGDLTFIANWAPSKYVVKYNLNGGEGVAKDYYTFIYSDAKGDDYVLQTPTKTGYTFEGWYKEVDFSGEKVTEIAKGTLGDQEFYAKWTLDTYTITYNTNGGLALGTNPTEYTAETPTIQLFACEKMYYNFVGWEDQDGNVINDIKQGSAGNLVITAKYTPCEYEIVYKLNGGEGEENGKYSYNETEAYVLQVPTREGYEFKGWCVNEDLSDTPVTEIAALDNGAKEYYAKWEIIEYTISYNLDGGILEPTVAEISSTKNSGYWSYYATDIFLFTPSTLTNAQYSYRMGVKLDSTTNEYKVVAISESGVATFEKDSCDYILLISESYEKYASTATFRNSVVVGDYIRFVGDPSTGAAELQKYIPADKKYTVEDEITLLTPNKLGYTFLGWYDSEDNKVEKVEKGSTGDLELTAKWEIITYSIEYDTNEGSLPKVYSSREEVVADFLADYNSARGKSHTVDTFAALGSWGEISDASLFLYNSTYRAKWAWLVDYIASVAGSANKKAWQNFNNYNNQSGLNAADGNYIYSIAYELRGFVGGIKYTKNANFHTADYSQESIGNGFWSYLPAISYTIESNDITLLEPTREDYIFLGWYDNADFNGTQISVIAKGSTGDLKLYAKWESAYKNIEYELNGGEWNVIDLSSATAVQTFTLTRYLGYDPNGYQASLHNAKPATWWKYIALVETTQSGVYEIKQIVEKNSNVTVAYDYVIMWHSNLNQDCKTALNAMFSSGSEYIGDYVTFDNLPDASTASANITVKVYNSNDVTKNVEPAFKYKEGVGASLVAPIKEGYVFAGWYDNAELSGTKLTSISTSQLGNIKLYAKWESNPYNVTLDTDGGQFTEILNEPTLDDFAEKIVNDFNNTGNSGATEITTRANFKSSSHPNIKYVWNNAEKLAEYKWFFEFALAEMKAAAKANGTTSETRYTNTVEMLEGLIAGNTATIGGSYAEGRTALRWWIEGLINNKIVGNSDYPFMVDYSIKENADRFLKVYQSLTCERVMFGGQELPTPVKDGYVFLGWFNESDELVTEINSNCVLTAKYEEAKVLIGNVGYASIQDAIDAASAGSVITLKDGTYAEAITINKAITIKGANAGIDPVTGTRLDETIFKNDIVIAANGIEIDGIKLTGNGRIKGNESGFDGLVIKNVSIADSTVNTGGSSSNGPLYFYTTGTSEFKNIVIENVKLTGGTSRPMIMYGSQINGLTIKNSSFVSVRSSYNDAIKIVKGGSYGIKGNVTIVGNHIENYQQYVLWFGDYAEGTYNIYNNNFVNCGITPANHGAAYFATYSGATTGKVEVDFSYNTVDNAYSLIRVSSTDAKTSSNHTIKCNYNKLLNCSATYYVNNADADISVDARYNYYDSTISDSKFRNAIYSDYYTSEEDIPTYPGE